MKRLHVNLTVKNVSDSVKFYSTLFDSEPTLQKNDYAQWLLDDPQVNFSIGLRGGSAGFNHVGIQVDSDEELNEMRDRATATTGQVVSQGKTVCCYAESEKDWLVDPQKVRWEIFHTTARTEDFGDNTGLPAMSSDNESTVVTQESASACCGPTTGCC